MRRLIVASFVSILVSVAGCGSSRSGFRDTSDAADPSLTSSDGGDGTVNRDAACAASVEQTSRAPGVLLLVLDRSFSMTENAQGRRPAFGEKSKWDVAVSALETLVDGLPNGLLLGLEMFPSTNGCDVAQTPQVALDDIKITRAVVKSALAGPSGDTPTTPALKSAYAVLAARKEGGARAALLLSDGAPNCGSSEASVETAVSDAKATGIRTFVVGIPGSPYSSFSRLAVVGGTARSPTCLESCADSWTDTEKCCHYATSASDFEATLTKALAEIAAQVRSTCVYTVPRPEGKPFVPSLVNVLVSVDGTSEEVLPQRADPNADGWSYTDGANESILIHGPLCEKILGAPKSKVEVLVGCPTQVR